MIQTTKKRNTRPAGRRSDAQKEKLHREAPQLPEFGLPLMAAALNVAVYGLLRSAAGQNAAWSGLGANAVWLLFVLLASKITAGKRKKPFPVKRIAVLIPADIGGVMLIGGLFGIPELLVKLLMQPVLAFFYAYFEQTELLTDRMEILSVQEKTREKQRKTVLALCFAVPALTMAGAFLANGVPFGDRGVLIIDSLHQYLPFFTEFHEKLVGGDSLRFSFGGGLGFNFWATYAYYLASPLNLIIAFFPMDRMMDVMALLIVLKIGISGLTFGWYIQEKKSFKNALPVAFACMFALSSFMIGYYFNLMWLDSIAMLPLVMAGIERIKNQKSGRLFCIALFYGLYCNYYIGFMLCLFSCLYFGVLWISARRVQTREFLESCFNFGIHALLAGAMAALDLIPAYMALTTTESAENSFPSKIKIYVENLSQLTSQFAFVEPVTIADNQIPVNAFCSVITLTMACLFVLDKKLSLRERLSKLALLLLLYASFDINVLNFIWHGFHVQNGLPNRFAFIYIAVLLIMTADVVGDLRQMSWERLLAGIAVPLFFVGWAWDAGLGEQEDYVYLATLILLGIYGLSFVLNRRRVLSVRVFHGFLSIFITAEMIVTAVYGVYCNGTVSRQTYLDDQHAYQLLMVSQEEDTESFFRADIDSTRMRNSNMFMGANGVVLFSSTMPAATVDLCKALGMEARTNKNGYSGLTKLVNDLFGVKYVVSRTAAETLYQMDWVDYAEPLNLYKNEGALSLGYMVNSAVKDWDIYSGNAVEIQDQFIELATGHSGIYSLSQTIEMEEDTEYTISLPAGMQVYMQVTSSVDELSITTPSYSKNIDTYNNHLYDLGCYDTDQTATLSCVFKETQSGPVTVNIYVCQDSEYQEVHDILAASQLEIASFSDEHIEGTITAEQDGVMMMSLPYDEGWKICVDGQKTDAFRIGEALTGIDLTAGTHTITLSYTPAGLNAGALITLAAALLFMLLNVWEKTKEKREMKKEEEELHFTYSDRANSFKMGIFSILNDKKNELLREGRKVYNFSVGTPDFAPAPHIVEAMVRAASEPVNYKYALRDLPELISSMQDFYRNRFGVELAENEIMTINGSQEGMAHLAWALCNPDDLVLVPNPGYPIFEIGPMLCDAKTWEYPLYRENGYLPKLDEIPEEIARKAKLMVVSYPLNPVCAAAGEGFYDELIAFAKKYQIIILHDNAYSDIIYGGRKGDSFLAHEGAKEVGVEFYSLSKSYNLTGARVSFALGNSEILAKFQTVRSQFDYGMFLPVQRAAIAALTGPQDQVREQCAKYEERMHALCEGLRSIGWKVPDSQGTMFVWAPIPGGYESSEEFCMELVEKSGVLCTPGSSFGSLGEGYVRFALVMSCEEIKEAVGAIEKSGVLKK